VQIKPVKLMDNEHPAFETRPSQENVVAGNVSRSTAAWRIVRKVMLISSVVTNIAFIAMLLGTLVWERAVESGQVLHAAPSAVESADSNVLRVAPSSAPMP
jgi:hypothetical protein